MRPVGLIFDTQNPYEGIYVTRRLDLTTGENIALLGGPGGAVRPEPSPDGRYLAYVKRIQTETALMLYDRQTGRHELLSSELDHDQQEVWAVFWSLSKLRLDADQ
jgi:Periplasmic component of the Tol biopolymer transport system